MTYIITFFDRTHLIVSDEQGEKIKMAKRMKVQNIEIGKSMYSVSTIDKIEPHKTRKADQLVALPEAGETVVKKETIQKVTAALAEKFNWPQR